MHGAVPATICVLGTKHCLSAMRCPVHTTLFLLCGARYKTLCICYTMSGTVVGHLLEPATQCPELTWRIRRGDPSGGERH
eukprot:1029009-Rhodomonas_salina.1